jgi:hypothetical protein
MTAFNLARNGMGNFTNCTFLTQHNLVKNDCPVYNTATCNVTGGPDDYICLGMNPLRDQAIQVAEDYEITDDPLDPKVRWRSH